MRYTITDDAWAIPEPMVRARKPRNTPALTLPDRMSFEAFLDRARTGIPWRDLPARFGPWSAGYNRPRRWVDSMV